jgi:phosphoribosylanthranilate isomerase
MRPRVKICCILDHAELQLAVDAGADAVGFVGPGLSGPEVREEPVIASLAAATPPGVSSFLLTRVADPGALAAQVVRCKTNVVQICDEVAPAAWRAVREAAPGVRIVQVIHVDGASAVERARAAAPHVDAVLLDSGAPTGPNPVYGGTGQTHDWTISARAREVVGVPVWLAGGLRASNAAAAIATVRPFGLDLCSGVRTGGRLDPDKLRAWMSAVHSAA